MDPKDVKRVLVVGAGTMGHSIAQVFAQAGVEVVLVDLNAAILERALRSVRSNLETLADYGRVASRDIPAIIDRIRPATDLVSAAGEVEFALEVVVEDSQVKKDVFRQLDESCPKSAVLASNTSSLDIFSIAEVSRPERLVVTHWFAPPHIIPLVEVVPGPETSRETLDRTAELMQRLGKRPVVLKKFAPSFIVNRLQNAVSYTVYDILDKGLADIEDIDLAVKTSLGIRLPIVGVVQSMDFTGLGLICDIMKGFGIKPPAIIQERVSRGHVGASASKGFYDYGGRTEEQILEKRDRLYLKMLDHLEKIKAFEPV
jgi:3-hydroxybutyryl-CoA dehydrogenase